MVAGEFKVIFERREFIYFLILYSPKHFPRYKTQCTQNSDIYRLLLYEASRVGNYKLREMNWREKERRRTVVTTQLSRQSNERYCGALGLHKRT